MGGRRQKEIRVKNKTLQNASERAGRWLIDDLQSFTVLAIFLQGRFEMGVREVRELAVREVRDLAVREAADDDVDFWISFGSV